MSESADDLGFNDDELADIMNEIESLEAEFAGGSPGETPSEEVKAEDNSASDNPPDTSDNSPEVEASDDAESECVNTEEIKAETELVEPVDDKEKPQTKTSAAKPKDPTCEIDDEEQKFLDEISNDPLFAELEDPAPQAVEVGKENELQNMIDDSFNDNQVATNPAQETEEKAEMKEEPEIAVDEPVVAEKSNQDSANNVVDIASNSGPVVESTNVQVQETVVAESNVETPVASESAHVIDMVSDVSGSKVPSSMEFKVSGDMSLNMAFEVNGKRIHATLSGKDGLKIDIEGGVELSIPLEGQKKVS
jgi:hypothetical protein